MKIRNKIIALLLIFCTATFFGSCAEKKDNPENETPGTVIETPDEPGKENPPPDDNGDKEKQDESPKDEPINAEYLSSEKYNDSILGTIANGNYTFSNAIFDGTKSDVVTVWSTADRYFLGEFVNNQSSTTYILYDKALKFEKAAGQTEYTESAYSTKRDQSLALKDYCDESHLLTVFLDHFEDFSLTEGELLPNRIMKYSSDESYSFEGTKNTPGSLNGAVAFEITNVSFNYYTDGEIVAWNFLMRDKTNSNVTWKISFSDIGITSIVLPQSISDRINSNSSIGTDTKTSEI